MQKTDSYQIYLNCISKDVSVQSVAFQQLGDHLLRVAHSRLLSKPYLQDQAQDRVQEAITTIWQKLECGQGPEQPQLFLSWCNTIVIRRVYDMLRKEGYALNQSDSEPDTKQRPHEEILDEYLPDPFALPPDEMSSQAALLSQLLSQIRYHTALSDDSKRVLWGGFVEENSDIALASLLDKERATIRSIRQRNLGKLKKDTDLMMQLREWLMP